MMMMLSWYQYYSLCLNFVLPTCPKTKFRKISIYLNILHNFHLSKSSFICPKLQGSGLTKTSIADDFQEKKTILLDFVIYFCRINLFLYIVRCPHEGCDKVFISPLSMGSHPRVHLHNKEDFTCKFEGCGRVFDKKCRLNQHMRSHTGEKPYICYYEVSMTTIFSVIYLISAIFIWQLNGV